MKTLATFLFLFLSVLQSRAGDWDLHANWAVGSNLMAPFPANDTIYINSGDVVRVHLSFMGGPPPPPSCFKINDSSTVYSANGNWDFYLAQPGSYEIVLICPTTVSQKSFVIMYGSPLGVEEKAKTNLAIFPSIFGKELTLDAGEKEIEVEFRLLNLAGQIVFEQRFTGSGPRKYDLGELPAGLYIAEVRAGNETRVQKLVKK